MADAQVERENRLEKLESNASDAGTMNHTTLTQVLHNQGADLPEPAIAQLLTLVLKKVLALNLRAKQPCGYVCSGAVTLPLGAVTDLPDLVPPTDEAWLSGNDQRYLSPARGPDEPKQWEDILPSLVGPASVEDDAWAVGVMAAECALGVVGWELTGGPVDAPAVLTMLAHSASPALGAFVRACLSNDPSCRPASALAMLMQPFIFQHAGASLWQLKEGRLQLQLTEEIVEAAARRIYKALDVMDQETMESFFQDTTVVTLTGDATTLEHVTSIAAAMVAIKKMPVQRYVVKHVDVSWEQAKDAAAGAQPSWIMHIIGIDWHHQLIIGMGQTDTIVIEQWDLSGTAEYTAKPVVKQPVEIVETASRRIYQGLDEGDYETVMAFFKETSAMTVTNQAAGTTETATGTTAVLAGIQKMPKRRYIVDDVLGFGDPETGHWILNISGKDWEHRLVLEIGDTDEVSVAQWLICGTKYAL